MAGAYSSCVPSEIERLHRAMCLIWSTTIGSPSRAISATDAVRDSLRTQDGIVLSAAAGLRIEPATIHSAWTRIRDRQAPIA